jgi:type IV pilus assembly protein PilV
MLSDFCFERRQISLGYSLIEILIAMVVLAIGMLGLATLSIRTQTSQLEAYQRANAALLVRDMAERIRVNRSNASKYVTGISSPVGTGDDGPTACAEANAWQQDICEWSNLLKGSAEKLSDDSSVGAMLGARGCIEEVQSPDSTAGVCNTGVYRVSVVWQGMEPTESPNGSCGKGLYGDDALRRQVYAVVTVGVPECTA